MTDTDADISKTLRIATPDDYQELFRVCCLLHHENGQHPFSEQRVRDLLWRGVNRESAIIGVVGPHDDIKAVVYLEINPIYYSDEHQLYERFAYVRPDSRKSDYAKRLLLFAKKCADDTGLDLLIGIISDVKLEAKKRLYERYLPKGGVWFNYSPQKKSDIVQAAE